MKQKSNALLFCLFCMICFSLNSQDLDRQIHYPLTYEPLDVVIPCHSKDLVTLERCIKGIKKNGQYIRRVIVISKHQLTDSAEWFPESAFPFSKISLACELFNNNIPEAYDYLKNPKNRTGWLFQQLLKLYASFIIPDLSSNVLILDADTIFLRPTSFITDQGWPLFNVGDEYHLTYFRHAARLLPGLSKVYRKCSGVTHHMVFQKPVLEDLFQRVETTHQLPFWKAFLRCIQKNHLYTSGASEYEIYFNFFLSNSAQFRIRRLNWKNSLLNKIKSDARGNYDYVSYHACDQISD